jgi:hypothetical protein
MKILFYSDKCINCKKILDYINQNNLNSFFNLININENTIPAEIDIIPFLIDDQLIKPIKGNSIYDYLINTKYFNNPTNNIEYIIPENPIIIEDDKALLNNDNNLELEKKSIPKIENKKITTLLQHIKRRR